MVAAAMLQQHCCSSSGSYMYGSVRSYGVGISPLVAPSSSHDIYPFTPLSRLYFLGSDHWMMTRKLGVLASMVSASGGETLLTEVVHGFPLAAQRH